MHPQQRMTLLHLAPMHDATDERRDDTPGRRSGDAPSASEHVSAADKAISIGWRWAQIIATIIGFGFLAGSFVLQSRTNEQTMRAISGQLTSIDAKLNAMAISDSGQDKELGYLKTRIEELKAEVDSDSQMQEARIISLERGLARQEARP